MKCDVLVLGAGMAGTAAAVTAARLGAHVVLLDRCGVAGGMATGALVHTVCGLYQLREEPGAVLGQVGVGGELVERLVQAGISEGPVRMGRVDVLPFSPTGMGWILDEWLGAEREIEVFFHTEITGVVVEQRRVMEVSGMCRGRRVVFQPKVCVDGSGDGVLAGLAGAEVEMTPRDRLQRPAFIFGLQGVDVGGLGEEGRLSLARLLTSGVQSGALDAGVLGAHFRATGRGAEVFVTVDLAAPGYDPMDAADLSGLERQGRALARELTGFLRSEAGAFAGAYVGVMPGRVGVRESGRVRGRVQVTADDVRTGRAQEEVVALGWWPMELRERATGPRWRFPEGLRPTQIPLGALKVKGLEGFWVAGRCVSCDHEAQAALRVMGTCLGTGQAAGAAAGLFVREGRVARAAEVAGVYGLEVGR